MADDRVGLVVRGVQPGATDFTKRATVMALEHVFRKKDIAERIVGELRDHATENGGAHTPALQRLLDEYELVEAGVGR